MKTDNTLNPVSRTSFRLTALAILLAVSAAGCDWISSNNRTSVVRGDRIEVDFGRTVRLGYRGPLLTFEDVAQDSRCPSDVVCVWAGVAEATFRLVSTEGDTTFTLSIPGLVTSPYEAGDSVSVHGLEFKLLELSPYPVHGEDIDSTEYRALLRVVEPDESPR